MMMKDSKIIVPKEDTQKVKESAHKGGPTDRGEAPS
jgi:hypothetical protein